jgi:hypothetical protein
MWLVYFRDQVNGRDLQWPRLATREEALNQACAIRKQTRMILLRVVDPSGREVPSAEIDEYYRTLPPSA